MIIDRIRRIQEVTIRLYKTYIRVIKLVWAASPRYFFCAILLTILGSFVPPAQVWISKIIIDRVVMALLETRQGIAFDWTFVFAPMGFVMLIGLIKVVFQSLLFEIKTLLGIQVRIYIEFIVLKKATELDMAFFETPAFYDKMDNILRNIFQFHNFVLFFLDLCSILLCLITMMGLLFRLHPALVLLLLVTAVPQALLQGHYANQKWNLIVKYASARRMATYLSSLLGNRQAAKEIRLFNLAQPLLERFRFFWLRHFNDEKRIRLSKEKINIPLGGVSVLGSLAILGYVIAQAAVEKVTIGDVTLAFQATEQSRSNLDDLFRRGGVFYEHSLFAFNLFEFLDLSLDAIEGTLVDCSILKTKKATVPTPIRNGIEFRNVSFRYPGTKKYILKNFSCTFKLGKTIAIVGENGAGKTTFVKLLTRLYDPTHGHIFLDGIDLREFSTKDLHRQLGVIFQDFVRYDLSIQENIGFGQIELIDDLERINWAAKKGGAQSMIQTLPRGLQTVLGRTFEKGVDLSGGEWQKLALSRAYMKESQVYILDEPTASLDAFSESKMYKKISRLTANKITILISHRFSIVRDADYILVLDAGRIVEEGTHDFLMTLSGQYEKMFTTQAKKYL